jgi:iron complex outermembrane receptor protein
MTSCAAQNVDPWNAGLALAANMCGVGPAATSSNTSLPGGIPLGAKYAPNGGMGYAKDDEYSGWQQYQPFIEIDIKPTENLVITPGVKYVHWNHDVNAEVAQGSLCGVSVACPGFNKLGQSFTQSFVTTDTLPFLQANYKIQPNWSVYAEFAKGIYVPDVSAFENSSPVSSGSFPSPQTTTNYQVGTVFYADNFTFDADVYVININNNYISATDSHGDTFYINDGKALYKGIEGEGTYAFGKYGDLDLEGLSIFANGALMSSKQTGGGAVSGNNPEIYAGLWEPNAPRWTFAGGLMFKRDAWKFAIIDKVIGAQYADQLNDDNGRLPSYNNLNLTAGYTFGFAEASISIDNLLNSRSLISISPGDAKDVNGSKTVAAFGPTSQSQYFYQAPRSVMGTLKVSF